MPLERRHGLFVSICFVVGFIVGTGIFFLPGRILYEVGGDVFLGAAAWVVGGLMIAPVVLMFGLLASRFEKIHGFVDYCEAVAGRRYGYLAGWFFAVMYQPAGYAMIAWITSGFVAALLGMPENGGEHLAFRFFAAAFFMAGAFMMNYFAPSVPVRFNVATTLARLVPLALMGAAGLFFVGGGAAGGGDWAAASGGGGASLFAAVSATAFAFNGWQAALAFNSEILDSKRKFPVALLAGFGLVAVLYVLYFVGVAAAVGDGAGAMMQGGGAGFAEGTRIAFANVFGPWAARVLVFFMVVSGLGILNACCLGMGRAMYALGMRGQGPLRARTALLDSDTNVPNHSMVMALGISFLWYALIYANTVHFRGFAFSLPDFYNFGFFMLLVPLFVCCAARPGRAGARGFFGRFALPALAAFGAGFMFVSYWLGSPAHAAAYLAAFAALALVGMLFYKKRAGGDGARPAA